MRYEIGQDYLFLHVGLESAREDGWKGFGYMPGVNKITSMKMVKLKCIEHHKVYETYDDRTKDPTHDGFVFEDTFGVRWNNQYPKASYGQTDTSNDYRVRIPEEYATIKTCMDHYTRVENILEDLVEVLKAEDDPRRSYNILKPNATERELLQEYFESLVFMAEQMLGKRVQIKPFTMTNLDGTVVPTNIDDVTFIEPESLPKAA